MKVSMALIWSEHPTMDWSCQHDPWHFKWTDVVKIDANGAVGWSRCVGHASADPTGPSPAFVHDVQGRGRLAVSNSGTVFYMEAGDGPLEHLRLFALDANGDTSGRSIT
ncbi:MAG: hypothetical protein IPN30_09815 [Flavobacteriales bacterium]|nr:hypothetical protein [Flavobacteriales bacterium]